MASALTAKCEEAALGDVGRLGNLAAGGFLVALSGEQEQRRFGQSTPGIGLVSHQ